tara:strand:- start:41281 stop:41946 length:666 start_codon:yes stop_codon:yes gene_type:complete
MKNIIIFGTKDLAQLAKYYFDTDPAYLNYTVAAFTADSEYITEADFEGLPIVPFENIEDHYSPNEYQLFAPVTGVNMNKTRENIYNRGKEKGYEFISYVSSKATVCGNKIGENCFILEDNTLQPFTTVGNNVVMWSGNHIGHHGSIGDHVFFTSHVVLSGHCNVGDYSWFGVNSTIRDGINLGKGTLVAMASCITKDTDEWGVYMGTPAKKRDGKRSDEVL